MKFSLIQLIVIIIDQKALLLEQFLDFKQGKVEDNPLDLNLFEPTDVKQSRKKKIMNKIQALTRKGDKYFKFKDTKDFNSYFTGAQRMERERNEIIFEQSFGKSEMVHRCIASQSEYNPNLTNQFRRRYRQKEIQPSMKYSHRNECSQTFNSQRPRSMNGQSKNYKKDNNTNNDTDLQQVGRRNTSLSSISFLSSEDEAKSSYTANTIKTESESSYSKKKNNTISVKKPYRKVSNLKQKQFSKSYFVGIIDIKLNTKDPHAKKSLHNILVKVGKSHPNSRESNFPLTLEALHSQMN